MSERGRFGSRFDDGAGEPLGPLANLVDIMLVFVCGLLVALAARGGDGRAATANGGQTVTRGRELAEPPEGVGRRGGDGMRPVGEVYRDPESGKLILVGEHNE